MPMTELLILAPIIAVVAFFLVRKLWRKTQKEPAGWFAGPIVRGGNKSKNVKASGAGFTFPVGEDGIHYFTKARGPITGPIRVQGVIDAAPDVRFIAVEDGGPATMSVYFSAGDVDWFGEGFDRWYCPVEHIYQVKPGPFDIEVPLTGLWWSAVETNSELSPAEFRAALAEGGRIGVVFGGNNARGHGAYATGPARFTIAGLT